MFLIVCLQLSLLSELGFGGVLLYIDPCDAPPGSHTWHQAFRVTLNPGGNPAICKCLFISQVNLNTCLFKFGKTRKIMFLSVFNTISGCNNRKKNLALYSTCLCAFCHKTQVIQINVLVACYSPFFTQFLICLYTDIVHKGEKCPQNNCPLNCFSIL